MRSHPFARRELTAAIRQRGVVLFFTLIALVVMSLAAVALIRSVDTSTMIAGNLAFKQAATSSGDVGIEAAVGWLASQQQQMNAAGQNVFLDTTPPVMLFNLDNPSLGYYSSAHAIADLTDGAFNWNTGSVYVGPDASGNKIWYIIERMCSIPNQIPPNGNCLYSTPITTLNNQAVVSASQVCQGVGCASSVQSPQLRITAQVLGPKNTYSYVQTFAY